MPRQPIQTDAAPSAIGPYSQAIQADNTVYLSGQIPLVPETMTLVEGDIDAQIRQVLDNLAAVAAAAGASLDRIVKLNVYMTDLGQFPRVNALLMEYFNEPYPARAVVGVAALPKGAAIEMEAVLSLAVE
mgnify:CR=1 FL=1